MIYFYNSSIKYYLFVILKNFRYFSKILNKNNIYLLILNKLTFIIII